MRADAYYANNAGRKLFEAFTKVLGLSRWDDFNLIHGTDPTKIATTIEEFRSIVVEIY